MSVTAAPKGGKATDHMVRFLAPLFGVTTVMGLIFVICVLAFRRGIVGELLALRSRRDEP